ncbi:Aminodeoxychorismate synthase component 2 [Planctomycetes bacterium Pla163]|uniref:Aminodeoxychorismate synthase component 2 n=1 Tax=Rohdeia mirabilis TaxID=2528008 RepID=A0A518CZQ1_9BACT|nr:Aminodeoxychorismate synthase component 2 [Planctomycetes bacterium Pla163]
MARVLFVDHEDSFTYNLVQYLLELGADVDVRRPDRPRAGLGATCDRSPAQWAREIELCDAVLIGPGPGGPAERVRTLALLDRLEGLGESAPPVLGVCLGLQLVAHWRGGSVGRALEPVHGFGEAIEHDGRGIFRGLPTPVSMARYHSLVAHEPLPADLEVSARSAAGEVMGLRSRSLRIEAVQFHPESILSEAGHALLSNFLGSCAASAEAPEA